MICEIFVLKSAYQMKNRILSFIQISKNENFCDYCIQNFNEYFDKAFLKIKYYCIILIRLIGYNVLLVFCPLISLKRMHRFTLCTTAERQCYQNWQKSQKWLIFCSYLYSQISYGE